MIAPQSKSQLRAERRHALNSWLSRAHMRMDESHYWPHEARAAEEAHFAELDRLYTTRKSALEVALYRMTVAEQAEWFASIAWVPVGATKAERIVDYMDRG